MTRSAYYQRALLFPYVAVILSLMCAGLAHLKTPFTFLLDPSLGLSALILSGSLIALPPYTLLAVWIWYRTNKNEPSDSTIRNWLLVSPLVVTAAVFGYVLVRGAINHDVTSGATVGFLAAVFTVVVGYFYVGLIALGARVLRVA